MKNPKFTEPIVLQSFYYTTFGGEYGQEVLRDLKLFMTGADIDEYESVDPSLPHHELAAKTALRNAWDYLEGLTHDLEPKKKMGYWAFFVENHRLWKYLRNRTK